MVTRYGENILGTPILGLACVHAVLRLSWAVGALVHCHEPLMLSMFFGSVLAVRVEES